MGLLEKFGLTTTTKAINLAAALTGSIAPGVNNALYGWLINNQNIFTYEDSYTYVKEGYTGNGDVYSVVDLILMKLSMCPLVQYEVKPDKQQKWLAYQQLSKSDSLYAKRQIHDLFERKDITEANIDGISKLLYNPNQWQTWTEFIKEYGGWYLIQGNSYLYKNGLPNSKKYTEMVPLPANYIHIVSGGAMKPVKGYKVIGSARYGEANFVDFTSEQVSQIKTYNPDYTTFGSQLYGMPPLRPFLLNLAKNKLTRKELLRQSKNGGPMGIFGPKAGTEMPPEIKQDIKEQLAMAKTSDELVKRIIVSRATGEWQQIGLPSVEMELLESLNVDQKEIANCYHVPVILLNNTEGSTYNNILEAGKQLIQNAVMPLGNIIADRLTRDLCPAYETGNSKFKLAFDYSVLPEMQQDLKTQAEALEKIKCLAYNEQRIYLGYGAVKDPLADQLLIDGGTRLLSDLAMTDDAFTNA